MPDGYLEAGFPKPGSLGRAVRDGALRDELPPVTCRPIHASWLCECGPRIKLARKETEQNRPLSGGPPIVGRRRARYGRSMIRTGTMILACALTMLLGCDRKSAAYRAGYEQGAKEAHAEIAGNTLTWYASGTHAVPIPEDLRDEETGLPVKFIAGCILTDADMGRQDGHNGTILEHRKKDSP